MKALVTGDWHGDRSTMGVSRFPEIERAAYTSMAHAVSVGCDAYVFLGDVADPDSGGEAFKSIELLGRVLINGARSGMHCVAIAGNHCVWNDGSGATCLTPLLPLEELGRAVAGSIDIVEGPRLVEVGEGHVLVCLPYASVARAYEPAAEAARMMAEVAETGRRAVVVAHLSVPGVVPGEETTEMPRGREVLFPFEETRGAHARFNGHYHRRQNFDPGDGGPAIIIPGTLARLTYGEEGEKPGFLVVEM